MEISRRGKQGDSLSDVCRREDDWRNVRNVNIDDGDETDVWEGSLYVPVSTAEKG